jgi:type IV secretion system protein TrbL
MALRRSRLARAGLLALLAALAALGHPAPERAEANVFCDTASGVGSIAGGVGIVGGAIGGGNPLGDACEEVTGDVVGAATAPVTGALRGIGSGIFKQVAAWVSEGAAWLMGRVVKAIDASTSPKLTAKGFVRQYRKMAEIAVVLAAAMLLLAVLEGLAQGSAGMLARAAFVNLPLAFIATSAAFVVVQLLLGATDGLSQAISSSTGEDGRRFFEDAIEGLGAAGGAVGGAVGDPSGASPVTGALGGAGGSAEVPLFVTFLAAVIGAFAAFFVWIELLMRDAAIYAVALFVPLSLAASIWPRWSAALRRTAELMIAVIASKFVIVAIISLAASLLSQSAGRVEQILAASALMLLASFAPFVLLRLVPFAEGAMAAAYARRSAGGGAVGGMHLVTQVQMMRNMARANWGGPGAAGTRPGGGGPGGGRSQGAGPGGGPRGGGGAPGGGPGSAGGASAAGGTTAGSGAAGGPAAAALPVAAAKGSKAAGERLGQTASAEGAPTATPSREQAPGSAPGTRPPRPQGKSQAQGERRPQAAPAGKSAESPEPSPAKGGEAPGAGKQAPRPVAEPPAPRPRGAKRGG